MNRQDMQPFMVDESKPVWQSTQPVSRPVTSVTVRTPKILVNTFELDPNASVQPSRPLRPMLTLKPQAGNVFSREAIENQIRTFFQT